MKRKTRTSIFKYPTLDEVLTFFFNVGSYEIRKKEPSYTPPTAAEFLHEINRSLRNTQTPKSGGSNQNQNKFELFLNKLVGMTVGTFDTSCSRMLSYFAIVVWASFFYTLSVSYFQFPESEIAEAFANPVFSFIDLLQGRMTSGTQRFQEIKENIRIFVDSMLPTISPLARTGIRQAILFIFNSEAYAYLVEKAVACLLFNLGDESCSRICNR